MNCLIRLANILMEDTSYMAILLFQVVRFVRLLFLQRNQIAIQDQGNKGLIMSDGLQIAAILFAFFFGIALIIWLGSLGVAAETKADAEVIKAKSELLVSLKEAKEAGIDISKY